MYGKKRIKSYFIFYHTNVLFHSSTVSETPNEGNNTVHGRFLNFLSLSQRQPKGTFILTYKCAKPEHYCAQLCLASQNSNLDCSQNGRKCASLVTCSLCFSENRGQYLSGFASPVERGLNFPATKLLEKGNSGEIQNKSPSQISAFYYCGDNVIAIL